NAKSLCPRIQAVHCELDLFPVAQEVGPEELQAASEAESWINESRRREPHDGGPLSELMSIRKPDNHIAISQWNSSGGGQGRRPARRSREIKPQLCGHGDGENAIV